MPISVSEIAELLAADYQGNPEARIDKAAPLATADAHSLSFLSSPKYRHELAQTKAGVVLLSAKAAQDYAGNAVLVADPYLAYARICQHLYPPAVANGEIHPSAVIDHTAVLGKGVEIGANAVIESGANIGDACRIGANCHVGLGTSIGSACELFPGVRIYAGCTLGSEVRVHANAVIGSDGFGYAQDGEIWVKIPQVGAVRIGDKVEIGANTCIDRGALDDTVIEEGVIIDNLVQVAHNVQIGAYTAIAGCVGIAGSAVIGRHCKIGGAATILGHLEIADHVFIAATSLVSQSITSPGGYASGAPLQTSAQWRRNQARYKQLDAMSKRISALEKKVKADDNSR